MTVPSGLLVVSVLYGICMAYCMVYIRKASRCTRSTSDEILLEVGKTRLATAGDRAFINVAPSIWTGVAPGEG